MSQMVMGHLHIRRIEIMLFQDFANFVTQIKFDAFLVNRLCKNGAENERDGKKEDT